MVNAGASIEAFLKLDASGFNTGIQSATTQVTKFKESMLEIGKEANTFNSGVNALSKALDSLIRKMTLMDTIDRKALNNFKTLTTALLDVATAAEKLAKDSMRGQVGIESLNTIMQVFNTGVSSAEIVVKRLSTGISTLGGKAKESSIKLSESEQTMRNQFLLLEQTLAQAGVRSDEFRAITQRLRSEYGLSGQKLAEVRSQLLQTTQATQQYATALMQPVTRTDALISRLSRLTSTIGSVRTTMQSWKSLTDGIVNSTLQNLSSTLTRVQTTVGNVSNSIKSTSTTLQNITTSLNTLTGATQTATNNTKMLNNEFNLTAKATQQYAHALQLPSQYMREGGAEAQKYRVLQQGVNLTIEDTINTIRRQSLEIQKNGAEKLRAMGYTGQLSIEEKKLGVSEQEVSMKTTQATSSIQRQNVANAQATNSTRQLTSATKGLGRALSSLRMIGTMVASMMVWNFAHNLITATRETVNAKSEMEGYFKMLHFNQTEIGNFNKALDNTVSKFQRINKYALGETISSIGVEFNLSTKEMEKAMPVVSMITSEYLRAGRNVNEASLAVKDILQGEFQRLSRETGVKGDQLKEAGWSGDKTDVMGLLEALEKVGKSRNWDVFVTKANSLNDAVLILQNRFSEWTAEMVNVVQPSILFVFNTLMTAGGLFGNVFSGIWQWLNGDGIANQVVKWTGLATAIGTVTTALIHYRTGANLVQLVQMGLRGSITATVFGLKAEEVATYGSRNAIVSKITSLRAEQVATMGVKNAIASKVLGLNAELVAQKGVKGAIMASTYANQLAKASEEGANAEKLKTIYLEQQEQLSKMGSLRAIFAKIAGVNMETFAEKGLVVALAERVASSPFYVGALKAEEVAELSTAEAALVLAGTLAPLVAVFVGLAIAVYGLVKPLQDASAEMKAFNTLNKDGDEVIKSHKKTMDSYQSSVDSLTEKRDKYVEGSKKWKRANDELTATQKDLNTATKNYENSIKAVEMVRSRQKFFDKRKSEIEIHNQTRLADAYIKAGLSSKEANEMASKELREATRGANQLRNALNMIKLEADKGAKKQEGTIKMLKNYGLDKDTIKKYGNNLAEANDKVREGMEKFMTSEDWMERVGGWFEIQQGRLEEWWTELNAFFEVRDWEGIRKKLLEGFEQIFQWTPIGQTIKGMMKNMSKKGLVGSIRDALFGEGDSDGALDIAWQFMNDAVIKPIGSWLSWFFEDPVAHFKEVRKDASTWAGELLFGKNSDGKPLYEITQRWMDEEVFPAIRKAIMDYFSWENIMKGGFTFGGMTITSLPRFLFGDESMGWDGIGKIFSDFFSDSFDSIFNVDKWNSKTDPVAQLGKWISSQFVGLDEKVFQPIMDSVKGAWANFISFNWLFGEPVSASDGSSDHPSFMEDLSAILGFDVQSWVNNFIADPMGTLGIDLSGFDLIGALTSFIFSNNDGSTDPNDISWLNSIFSGLTPENILNFVNTNIINPFAQGILMGIANIPIIGSIAQMLGLVPMENDNAYQTGYNLIDNLKRGVEQKISEIPIVGDIARMLGLVPQENPDAHSKGHGIGDNLNKGTMSGMSTLGSQVVQEFQDALGGIGRLGEQAYNTARNWADQLWQGVNSILQRASPGFFHDQFQLEFGQDIPNAITEAGSTAYSVAQTYGQQISEGINATSFNTVGFDSAVGMYQDDAQMVADSSYLMGTTTTTAFNDMTLAVNQTTNTMTGNVVTSYSDMQSKQQTSLNSMKTQNLQAYNDMYLKSNQSLIQMRDSTSNITAQMVSAWGHMKNQLVATANQLRSESTGHFNQLSDTIGSFYRKIQNPSSWGAGSGTSGAMVRGARHPSQGKSFARVMTRRATHSGAGGPSPYSRSGINKTMTLRSLKNMICPSGSCDIFDGYDLSQKVDVGEFLSSIEGEHGFGWGDWSGRHYSYINDTSDQWSMKSPTINLVGGIPTDANYKVGDFENGTPKISFGAFQSMAESIFTAIPYRFYNDSDWKGSWLGALQAGACNCSDGAEALIAFAQACGFDGYKQHGTWTNSAGQKFGHFWAVINGKKMDTTGWQHGYGWNPSNSGAGGIPVRRATHSPMSVDTSAPNITININEPVYGVDDLDNKIQESIKQGLREEFNDPWTVAI